MNNPNLTTAQLLQELRIQLKNGQIGFWIENQDCYLWQNTFHYSNKVKVGDLSLTKEKYWADWMVSFEKYYQASESKRQMLTKQFQAISDVALIEELSERIKKQSIKLSMYPNQEHIYIEGKDIDSGITTPLPIEIKDE